MKRKRKKAKIGKTGCLFWLLILLIVVILFLYKGKGSFKETISYFKDLINKSKVEEISKKESKPEKSGKKEIQKKVEIQEKTTSGNKTEKTVESKKLIKPPETSTIQKTAPSIEKAKIKNKKLTKGVKTKTLTTPIYFIKIELDGSAKPYPIKRKVQYKDSPITMTLKTLLKGPTPSERKKGLISFIPEKTKLLSASIKNGHLVLNFNDAIEENYSGRDAILLELSQILYTCFEFNSVKSVSILINNKRKQYLTGEGIPLKTAYTRNDLLKIWN